MKFKNVSEQKKAFKKKNEWHDVNPGESVELDVEVDKNEEGLERLEESQHKQPEPSQNKEIKQNESNDKDMPKKSPRIKAFKSEEELKEMTKDQLNDYAARNGLGNVSHRMLKATMIQKIIKYIKEKIQ